MKYQVFIHTNNKQGLGAIISKYSIEKYLSRNDIPVSYINVDGLKIFKDFAGSAYKRNGIQMIYDPKDLQSFTLSRFMPPELMNYEGRAIVIDPDIFSLQDIFPLLSMDLGEAAIAACTKKDAFDTSLMVLDCAKLRHWNMKDILQKLTLGTIDYADLITLKTEQEENIMVIPRIYNNLDTLTPDTVLIHMTNRLTQPWKTGLRIDFTRNKLPKLLGIIPREWVLFIQGKYPLTYQAHPNKDIEKLFLDLVSEAISKNVITIEYIKEEIRKEHVRSDLLSLLR